MAKQILAWGATFPAPVAAGATGTATFDVSESGVSGRFVIDNDWDGCVTDVVHRNKRLITGLLPISLFQEASQVNPRLRRFIQINDPLSVSLRNDSAAALSTNIGLTAAPQSGAAIPYEGDALREYRRDLIAFGSDVVVDLAVGATQQFTLQLLQAGRAGFLAIGALNGVIDGLAVTEVTYDNVALLDTPTGVPASMFSSNNPDSPLWGPDFILQTNHRLTVSIRNDTAAIVQSVGVGVTAG